MTEQNLGLIMGPNILHKEVSQWQHYLLYIAVYPFYLVCRGGEGGDRESGFISGGGGEAPPPSNLVTPGSLYCSQTTGWF